MNFPIEKNKNIIVIGDIMLDQFHFGKLEDSSKEDPLARILKVDDSKENLGGAGNVAANIKSMNSAAHIICVVGNDLYGERIKELCEDNGIGADGIFIDNSRPTTLKTRLYDNDQIIRFDKESSKPISKYFEEKIINHFDTLIITQNIDGIILQDYNKGVLTKYVIGEILNRASSRKIPVFVDPKEFNFFEYKDVTIFKPNLREINWALPNLNYQEASRKILDRLNCRLAVVTLSEKGIYIKSESEENLSPSLVNDLVDVCGAGDTVIAILSLTYLSKCNMNEMSYLANLAAANVCSNTGVTPIEYEKLTELYASHSQDKDKYDIA